MNQTKGKDLIKPKALQHAQSVNFIYSARLTSLITQHQSYLTVDNLTTRKKSCSPLSVVLIGKI